MTAASLPLIVSSTRSVRLRRRATSSSAEDRKSTRLNSSHSQISYAVFCLKKKKHMSQLGSESRAFLAIREEAVGGSRTLARVLVAGDCMLRTVICEAVDDGAADGTVSADD